MKVDLLKYMGSDLDVVNAARVSFDKESEWKKREPCVCGMKGPCARFVCGAPDNELVEADAKLIHYLAKHQHWTPFSHCYAKFRIKAPLFVRSQLFKHKVGLTENEVSRRYVDSEPEFYKPDAWRKRAADKKQGSTDEPVDGRTIYNALNVYTWGDEPGNPDGRAYYVEPVDDICLQAYQKLLDAGVCPEQARMVLPQSTYTEWIWSGSIAAFARVYQQRTSEHAQQETRWIALAIGDALEPLFPVSWKALCEHS